MEINNLDYVIVSMADSDRLYAAGSASTYAYTFAGPGAGFADAAAFAVGQSTLAQSITYALAQESEYTRNAYGSAMAYAIGMDARHFEDSHAVSSSSYRSTSRFSHITASSSFSGNH